MAEKFEMIIGEALIDANFAQKLEAAGRKLQLGDAVGGRTDFQNAVNSNQNLGFQVSNAEVEEMVGLVLEIDFDAITKVATAFSDEKGFVM